VTKEERLDNMVANMKGSGASALRLLADKSIGKPLKTRRLGLLV
jgi:hypothetical protein